MSAGGAVLIVALLLMRREPAAFRPLELTEKHPIHRQYDDPIEIASLAEARGLICNSTTGLDTFDEMSFDCGF